MGFRTMDFSPDGRLLAIGHQDRSIRLFSTASGEELRRMTPGAAFGDLSFHPDGNELAVAGYAERIVEIRDVGTGKVVRTLSMPADESGTSYVVRWHPDGELLAAGTAGGRIYIWNARTGVLEKNIEVPRSVVAGLAFNPAGNLLASTVWGYVTALWDPYGGKKLLDVGAVAVQREAQCVRFSADGKLLAYNVSGRKIQLWQVAHGKECLQLYGGGDGTWDTAFHPDGRLVAVADNSGVRLWDLDYAKPVGFLPLPSSFMVRFAPNGQSLIVIHRSSAQRWPVKNIPSKPEHLEIGPPETLVAGPIGTRGDTSQDGKWVAASDPAGQITLTEMDNPQHKILLRHARLNSISISPDRRWVATGTWKGAGVKIWDGKSGASVCDLPHNFYSAIVEFSPDGRWLVTSEEEQYRFWEVGSWKAGRRISRERNSDVPGPVGFSPDTRIAALAITPHRVRLIDVEKGDEIATWDSPDDEPIGGLRFSTDGTRLAVSASGVLQVWDLRAVREQLAKMGLDWDLSSYPPAKPTPRRTGPLKVEVLDAE
jgi:WD40 repeat protein